MPETRRATARSFNARPLVLCAAGVSLGIFLAYRLSGTLALAAACLFLCCGLLALCFRRAALCVLLFALSAGVFRMLAALPTLPPEGACTLTGCVAEAPVTKDGFTLSLIHI